ncbi:uncharacterized protein LOC123005542 [Tribolium madens]|uniref:uncharacterized protein LOC123005542 n=1 Tax=Tribolium madens TaxID=41895 RepID=UPI001CF74F14|nr:uncharacterized protein LOC123005542 [Tribolium madens]
MNLRFFDLIFLFLAVFLQLSYCATIQEVKTVLTKLRETAEDHLHQASLKHSRMSVEISSTALWTEELGHKQINQKAKKFLAKTRVDKITNHHCKGSRENAINHIKQTHTEELVKCVENHATNSLQLLFEMKSTLSQKVLKGVYEEEKNMVVCGRSNYLCLDGVVANIKDKIDSLDEIVQDEIDVSLYEVEMQLDIITTCAFQSILNTDLSLKTISNCTY